MTTQNTSSASIDLNRQLLYYTIRLHNTDDTLHAWMRHILAYLTSAGEELQPVQQNQLQQQQQQQRPQEPHLASNDNCDGSSDCPTNSWVRELSYEQHCRKLLMSRVNVGDTHLSSSVDEDSLRREASLVMESVNRATNDQSTGDDDDNIVENSSMDVDDTMDGIRSECDSSAGSSEWDFVMYDSDIESEIDSMDDPSYKPCGSDLLKLDDDYTSDDDDDDRYDDDEFDFDDSINLTYDEDDIEDEDDEDIDNLSNYTYDVRLSSSLRLNGPNAGSTEQRTVKICRQYNNRGGNKTRSCRDGCLHERAAGVCSVVSADNGCEYFSNGSDNEGDEGSENECKGSSNC